MRLVADVRRVVLLSLSFWMQVFGLAVLVLPELWSPALSGCCSTCR